MLALHTHTHALALTAVSAHITTQVFNTRPPMSHHDPGGKSSTSRNYCNQPGSIDSSLLHTWPEHIGTLPSECTKETFIIGACSFCTSRLQLNMLEMVITWALGVKFTVVC